MGTYVTLTLASRESDEIIDGFNLIRDIEMSLSSYNQNAKVYKLNKTKQVEYDDYLLDAIKSSLSLYEQTDGYFDITIGSLTRELYHFGEEERVPLDRERRDAYLDIDGISVDEKNITLEPNITIDLGGIGKGYAVDKVAEYFKSKGINIGKIALSGDIRCINPSTVFIDSPFGDKPIMKLQTLHPDTSISTSGTYRRFVKDRSHHHLINPKTKKQSQDFISVTLITLANNTLIDGFATAIGTMDELDALKLLTKHPEIGFILVKSNKNIIYGNLDGLVITLSLQ